MKRSLIVLVTCIAALADIRSDAAQLTTSNCTGNAHITFGQRLVLTDPRVDTDVISATFQLPQFPPCRGTLNRVRVRLLSTVDPVFNAVILAPSIAGVNANLTCRYFLTVAGLPSGVAASQFFNGSDTFTLTPRKTDVTIDYPLQTLITDYYDIPSSALGLYRGSGQVAMPMRDECIQEETISNTGMLCQFQADLAICVEVLYDYTPPEVPPTLINSIRVNDSGEIILTWNSVPCVDYLVQDATDIESHVWRTLGQVTASSASTSLQLSREPMPRRFFRIVTAM